MANTPKHQQDRFDARRRREHYKLQYRGEGGGYGQLPGGLNYDGAEPARRDHQSHGRIDQSDTGGYTGGRFDLSGSYDGGRFDYGIDFGDNGRAREFEHGDGLPEKSAPARRVGYRGLGPRGYRRADARILEDVSERLMDDPQLDATDVEVSVSAGEVTLSGSVDSRSDRRLAEDIAYGVTGVREVLNNLRIQSGGYGT